MCIFMMRHFSICFMSFFFLLPAEATQVVFVNGSGDDRSRILTNGGDSSICRRGNPLPGLEKTRRVLGLPNCTEVAVPESELANEIDLLILVDDRQGIDDDLTDRIDSFDGEMLTCSTSGPRKRIYPNYVVANGEENQLRALIVGEEMIDTYFSETNSDQPWLNYIRRIIQRRQGIDASPDSGPYSPAISSNAANGIPIGKGLFQNRPLHRLVPNRYRPNKMDHMANQFHDNGLNWFAISAPVGGKCEGRLYTEFIRFGHPTFQTYIWRLNQSDNIEQQIGEMIRAVKNTGSQGMIIDIEGQDFRNQAAQARELYSVARDKATEFSNSIEGWPISVGITVIGDSRIKAYLNEEDLREADFLMPQIYNRADALPARTIQTRINFWVTAFSESKVIPLAGAHHCDLRPIPANPYNCENERPKNSTEFENAISQFRDFNLATIGWWRYGSVENGNHWQKIRDFEVSAANQ